MTNEEEKEIRNIFDRHLDIPMARISFLVDTFKNWSEDDLFKLTFAIFDLRNLKRERRINGFYNTSSE